MPSTLFATIRSCGVLAPSTRELLLDMGTWALIHIWVLPLKTQWLIAKKNDGSVCKCSGLIVKKMTFVNVK